MTRETPAEKHASELAAEFTELSETFQAITLLARSATTWVEKVSILHKLDHALKTMIDELRVETNDATKKTTGPF